MCSGILSISFKLKAGKSEKIKSELDKEVEKLKNEVNTDFDVSVGISDI